MYEALRLYSPPTSREATTAPGSSETGAMQAMYMYEISVNLLICVYATNYISGLIKMYQKEEM